MKNNLKILFVGNSLTYYNFMPNAVKAMFEAAGISAECVMVTASGKCLDYQATAADVKYNILYGNYDYIIIQGKAGGFETEPFLAGGEKIMKELVAKTDSKPILYNVWCLKGHMKDQKILDDAYAELSRRTGAPVAPAGRVFHRARRIHGIPELYREDGNHPTAAGTYVVAAAVFYAITKRDRAIRLPDSDGYYEKSGLTLSQAEKIHAIACAENK